MTRARAMVHTLAVVHHICMFQLYEIQINSVTWPTRNKTNEQQKEFINPINYMCRLLIELLAVFGQTINMRRAMNDPNKTTSSNHCVPWETKSKQK